MFWTAHLTVFFHSADWHLTVILFHNIILQYSIYKYIHNYTHTQAMQTSQQRLSFWWRKCRQVSYSRSLPTTGYLAVKCLYQPAKAVCCSSVNSSRVKSNLFAFHPDFTPLLSSIYPISFCTAKQYPASKSAQWGKSAMQARPLTKHYQFTMWQEHHWWKTLCISCDASSGFSESTAKA